MKFDIPLHLPGAGTERGLDGWVFDVGALYRRLQAVSDLRCPKGVRYELSLLLLLSVLAKLSGADTACAIADWVRYHKRELRAALSLRWKRMPHHNTYPRFSRLGAATSGW